jgi:RNA polymerase sigma-70 factor (ECF subfamily)
VPRAARDRLTEFVAAHQSAVANYLRRRLYPLTAADLDDLVEETFLVCWRRLDDVPTGASERPWVIGVARHVLHNAHRSHRRRRHHESRVRPVGARASAEEEAVADLAVREALDALGEADRELLRLHCWDGVDVHGLALVLGVSTNAAGTRLSRAKSRFVDALAEVEARHAAESRRTETPPSDRQS